MAWLEIEPIRELEEKMESLKESYKGRFLVGFVLREKQEKITDWVICKDELYVQEVWNNGRVIAAVHDYIN